MASEPRTDRSGGDVRLRWVRPLQRRGIGNGTRRVSVREGGENQGGITRQQLASLQSMQGRVFCCLLIYFKDRRNLSYESLSN